MNIVCVKIGSKYSSDLVNNLLFMCRKNLSTPFKFFCYTDDPSGISSDVNIIPFVDHDLDVVVFNKLYLFSEEISQMFNGEKVIYFDLDIVIKSNIDHVIEKDTDELQLIETTWRYLRPEDMGAPLFQHNINSSCMVWFAGTQTHIWNHFMNNSDYFMLVYHWGMDSYLFYEHNVRGNLPRDQFYSHYYGVDETVMIEYANEKRVVNMLKLKHITDPIPIVLLNGPTTSDDYKLFDRFTHD